MSVYWFHPSAGDGAGDSSAGEGSGDSGAKGDACRMGEGPKVLDWHVKQRFVKSVSTPLTEWKINAHWLVEPQKPLKQMGLSGSISNTKQYAGSIFGLIAWRALFCSRGARR